MRKHSHPTAHLILHVGPTPYRVVLSDRAIYHWDGSGELEGCALESRRLIVLSRIVHPSRREEVAEHEFYHCWMFHVPKPRDEEEAAQLHSLVSRQFRQDLEAAGGPDALLNLPPITLQIGSPGAQRKDTKVLISACKTALRDLVAHSRKLMKQNAAKRLAGAPAEARTNRLLKHSRLKNSKPKGSQDVAQNKRR